jgi:hypothetical protein
MKTLLKFSIIATLLTSLWFGCKKEAPETNTDENIIAFLDGGSGVLYVTADRVESILELYGAEPADPSGEQGVYFMNGFAPDGAPMPILFHVKPALPDDIYQTFVAFWDDPDNSKKPSSKVEAGKKCGKTVTKKKTACKKETAADGTNYYERTEYMGVDGNITYSVCQKGAATDQCPLWNTVIGHERQYAFEDCDGLPTGERAIYEYTCR